MVITAQGPKPPRRRRHRHRHRRKAELRQARPVPPAAAPVPGAPPVLEKRKPWFASVVMWFNFFSIVLIIAEAQSELLRQWMSPELYSFTAITIASINMYLRMHVHSALDKHGGNQPDKPAG